MSILKPRYGEVWLSDLEPARGNELTGKRPVVIVSHDKVNSGPSGVVIVAPLTSIYRKHPWHIKITPPEGGLNHLSFALCDHIRAISKGRLLRGAALGDLHPDTLAHIRTIIHFLLG